MLKIKTQNSTPDVTIYGMECSECGKFIGNTKLFAGSSEIFRDGFWKKWMYCPFCGKELGKDVEITADEEISDTARINNLEAQVEAQASQIEFLKEVLG